MLNQPCISWDNLYLIMIPLFLFYITGSHLLIILFLALCELQLFSLILPGFFFPRLQENFSYKCTDQSSTEKHVPFLLRIARGFFLCSSLPFGNCYVTPQALSPPVSQLSPQLSRSATHWLFLLANLGLKIADCIIFYLK